MIILEAINTTGMFSCGLMPTIPLENIGCVFVRGINEDHGGGSNGAGKSSILNAIKEIAFEINDTNKSGPNIVNKHKEWTRGSFGILWLRDKTARRWRISYLRKWKGLPPDQTMAEPSDILVNGGKYQGSDLFLERWDGQKWVDERPTSMTTKTTKSTKDKIRNEVLGMTYEQFSAYVCLGQQAESALVMGTGGEREKIIQAITDVSIWDNATSAIKNVIDNKESQLQQINARVSGFESAISALAVPNQNEIDAALAANEAAIAQHDAAQRELKDMFEIVSHIEKELCNAQSEIDGIKQELDILSAEERHSYERAQQCEVTQPQEINVLSRRLEEAKYEAAQINKLIDKMSTLKIGTCPTCAQPISELHISNERERLLENLTILANEATEQKTRLDMLVNKHNQDTQTAKQAAQDKCSHELKTIHIAKDRLLTKMNTPSAIPFKLEHARANVVAQRAKIVSLDNNVKSTWAYLKMMADRVEEQGNLQNTLRATRDEVACLSNELQHLKWVERNLKKVKLTEYESAIERLNILINDELYRIWGPGLNARFVTAQDKARGGIKQELNFMAYTPKKDEVPIEMYSGGERKAVVIATFKAMKRLANERGLGINLAAIDEIDKDLDDANTDRLVEAFESIASDSPSCIVISHNTRLLNTMRFDNIWTVRKTNEFSTIEFSPNVSKGQVA